MTLADVLRDCTRIIPELILVATLCAVILTDIMLPREKSPRTGWIALGGLVAALVVLLTGYGDHAVFASATNEGPIYPFSGIIVIDELGDFFKAFFLLGTIAVVLFSMTSVEIRDYRHGEYYTLMLASVAGGALLVSSNNLLMLVLALETLSLCSYVLVGYLKHNRLSAEASLKYILYGSVASGVMLFGISYLYGMAGTLEINRILLGIAYGEDNQLAVLLAFVLVMAGVGFKMAAVPFHFWAPDVYQGAPTPITAFLSVVSKAAGFAAAFRMLLPLYAMHGVSVPTVFSPFADRCSPSSRAAACPSCSGCSRSPR
jgi:NADH-quinone oxidoreductase subunit N